MTRIMLFCAAGISTGLLVERMEKEVAKRELLDVEIRSVGQAEFEEELQFYDVCLLGPQVRYLMRKARELGKLHNVPIDAIPPLDYGTINAKRVLDQALALIEEHQAK